MNEFVRCNKLSGVYWLQAPVDQLVIKIRLKPPDDIISLPKFEEYVEAGGARAGLEPHVQEYCFRWREEVAGEQGTSRAGVTPRVFTRVEEEYSAPAPSPPSRHGAAGELTTWLRRLVDGALDLLGGRGEPSEGHLLRSHEDEREDDHHWATMHVLLDNLLYDDEGGAGAVRQQTVLVSVRHNRARHYVVVTPDVNCLETNPYSVEPCGGDVPPGCRYSVGVQFGARRPCVDLDTLLLSVLKKWETKHAQLASFALLPPGKTRWLLLLEVETARGFPAENLYIHYHIKLAEGMECSDPLEGRSAVSGARDAGGTNVFHYGHQLELQLETEAGAEAGGVEVYLEAVSVDVWCVRRCEGYCRLVVPLAAGGRRAARRCVRPDEPGAAQRRLLLGGCHLLPDLDVLSAPHLQNGDYTYTQTGIVSVRTALVAQRAGSAPPARADPAVGAAALLRGAEAALSRYRRARARLQHATAGG